jgi:predicted nucleic acid-binding protein
VSVFVDTSAFLVLLDDDSGRHREVAESWIEFVEEGGPLWCTNYVLLETSALIQRRLGMEALRRFFDLVPVLSVHWIEEPEHHKALAAVLATNRRNLSLVDCTSFETMRTRGLSRVLTLDIHFQEQGFECLPAIGG